MDFTISNYYSSITAKLSKRDSYLKWISSVGDKTIETVVNWMRVGFVHGVVNTDNMSVLGLTLDYGPYGWLEEFDSRLDSEYI